MPLPVSKSALDRIGSRLAASDPIEEADLAELAPVLTAYQEVLDQVKAELGRLGYAATTRVKTTGTLVDKLRRETARLSQVQDLAGARIVVPDRAAQDGAVDAIRDALDAAGCICKIIDRRKNPSYGYRAVHLIVQMDKVPVEVQVRTGLQDAWAQIVERLADRWGRGIRYGGEPENPDARVRIGTRVRLSRREVMASLGQTSDAIAVLEEIRGLIDSGLQTTKPLARVLERTQGLSEEMLTEEIPPETMVDLVRLKDLTRDMVRRLPEDRSLKAPDWETLLPQSREITLSDVTRVTQILKNLLESRLNQAARILSDAEHRLRDTLQLIADASDE